MLRGLRLVLESAAGVEELMWSMDTRCLDRMLDALEFCRHVSHPSHRNPHLLFPPPPPPPPPPFTPHSSISRPALPLACLYHSHHKQSGKRFILPLRPRLANCEGSLCVCVCVCLSVCVHARVPHKRSQRVVSLDCPRSLAVLTTGVTLTNTHTQYLRLDVPQT